METKMEKIKEFVTENSELIIGVSILLVAGGLVGYKSCKFGQKAGFTAGFNSGYDKALYEIVEISNSEGLVMVNDKLGRYMFTAKKLSDK